MNNTIKELYERKSVRVFTDEEITKEQREEILTSAMQAPTAGNQQMYTIIDVQNQDIKDKMAILCDNQPFIAKAKLVLVFCADFRKWYDAFVAAGANPRKPAVGDLMISVTDASIAAQNAVVAAHSMGIGSCYIGDVMENAEKMKETLILPEYVFPCVMLVFGYPKQQQKDRPKPLRSELEDIVCVDTYKEKDDEALKKLFANKYVNSTFEEWAQAFCNRKYNSDFSKEMSRSVKEYLKEYLNN